MEQDLPRLRNFGVLGDIHAEDARLAIALDALARDWIEPILSVGDIVDGPGDVAACCHRLAAAGVLAVRGNHERWVLAGQLRSLPHATIGDELDDAARGFLAALPATRRFTTELGELLLCHGLGEHDMKTVKPDDEGYGLEINDALWQTIRTPGLRFVVCGHSHLPMVRTFEGVTVINAGTLSRFDTPGFVRVDIPAREVTFFAIHDDGSVGIVEVAALPPR